MPGLRQPFSAHIEQIRNDLRERYKGGFPILKELLQNADDAGGGVQGANASEVVFLLTCGIPKAQHVLLRTPGLCLLNDGDFTATDADSISSYGSSIRGGQAATVGRFGLGLKSVFHWAEAFFYFSSANFTQQDNGSPPFDLLHPWTSRDTGKGFHENWDEQWKQSKQCDRREFENLVRSVLNSGRWFGLWIPFRTERLLDGVSPILPKWPAGIAGGLPPYDALFGPGWESRIVEVLPLLRRLRRVRFCAQEAESIQPILDFKVEPHCQRMMFLANRSTPLDSGTVTLKGGISVLAGDASPKAAGFRGLEMVPATESAVRWQEHKSWPRPFVQTENGGEEPRPDKAAEHGAVLFVRQRAIENQVRVQSAVFLPLGEPETHSIKGEWSYGLFLHGHFFVDSGRRDIEQFSDLPPEATFETTDSQEAIRKLWNRTLLHEVVAPLVLPSLCAFVQQEEMKVTEIEALVEVLARSTTLKKLSGSMCLGQRFIFRLKIGGGEWAREEWIATGMPLPRWLELPQPDFPETELFELLPTLAHLCGEASVSFKGKPKLADSVPEKPSDEDLSGLLGAVDASAFQRTPRVQYLLKLIPDKVGADTRTISSLVHLANGMLNQQMPEDKDLRELWNQFFERLPDESYIRLPHSSTEVNPRIVRTLAEARLPVALVWREFRNADGKGSLDWESLLPLLQSLGGLYLDDEVAVRQRAAIVVRLLKPCQPLQPAWTEAIAELPLFAACTPSGVVSAITFAELQAATGEGLVFTGGKEWVVDLAKAAPTLKLLLITPEVGHILDFGSSACDAAACVSLLRNALRLAEEFTDRKPLFEQLLKARLSDDNGWAALRCLIHGQASEWANDASMFWEASGRGVYAKLASKALTTADRGWRLISAHTAGQLALNEDQERRLKLQAISADSVQALIKETGPANVDCADLSDEDCDTLLLEFNDVDVLRGLNIHETAGNERVCARRHTYINDDTFDGLPSDFNTVVTRLRDRAGYSRQFTSPSGTTRLVDKLSWEAVIQIALDQPEPAQWWKAILIAIGHLEDPRKELRDRISETSWLPRSDGTAAAPLVLIHLPGAEGELERLPDSVLDDLVPVRRLKDEAQNHPSFGKFKSKILPPAKDAFALLATRLKSHSTFSTGLTGEWTAEQTNEWVQTLGLAGEELSTQLPIAPLVKVLNGEKSVQEYLPAFLNAVGGTVGSAAYAAILKHLAAGHQSGSIEARPPFEQLFLRYLNAVAACGVDFTQTVIRTDGVRLLSAGKQWKSPSLLTFATAGIHADDRLDPRLAQILTFIRPTAPDAITMLDGQTRHVSRQTDAELAQQLRQFFYPWRQVDLVPDPVGAFLSLLGTGPAMLSLLHRQSKSSAFSGGIGDARMPEQGPDDCGAPLV